MKSYSSSMYCYLIHDKCWPFAFAVVALSRYPRACCQCACAVYLCPAVWTMLQDTQGCKTCNNTISSIAVCNNRYTLSATGSVSRTCIRQICHRFATLCKHVRGQQHVISMSCLLFVLLSAVVISMFSSTINQEYLLNFD